MVIHHNPQSLFPTDYYGLLKSICSQWWATFTKKSDIITKKSFIFLIIIFMYFVYIGQFVRKSFSIIHYFESTLKFLIQKNQIKMKLAHHKQEATFFWGHELYPFKQQLYE